MISPERGRVAGDNTPNNSTPGFQGRGPGHKGKKRKWFFRNRSDLTKEVFRRHLRSGVLFVIPICHLVSSSVPSGSARHRLGLQPNIHPVEQGMTMGWFPAESRPWTRIERRRKGNGSPGASVKLFQERLYLEQEAKDREGVQKLQMRERFAVALAKERPWQEASVSFVNPGGRHVRREQRGE